MKTKMNINEIMFAFSTALDAVEGELIGATTYHSQRVAYISSLMARELNLGVEDRICIAVAAVLHDNALTQYAQDEMKAGIDYGDIKIDKKLGEHCSYGEQNVSVLPIYPRIRNVILFHHERADGKGPFGKKPEEVPLFARIIHLADIVDVSLDFTNIDPEKYERVVEHIKGRTELYDEEVADAFLSAVTYKKLEQIQGKNIIPVLYEEIPRVHREYSSEELTKIAQMFARIIDFKSPFTTRHSLGIAEKAKTMGEYYGWGDETCNKLYFAGAVHDIGKLLINRDVLEKPGKLTDEEYKHIQNHAVGSYVVLNPIHGIEDITSWACMHHEKLDGSGYPFGKTADELGEKERLMACLDIYQALVEPRPYKDGMPHEKAISILREMVDKGQLDGKIVDDIDTRFMYWVEAPIH